MMVLDDKTFDGRVALGRRKELPQESGIYFVFSGEECVYIGRSVNIKNRWRGSSHHRFG